MTFWEKFYELCVSKNTKPNAVAKQLGFSSAVCTQWKKGLQNPSYDKLSKIAGYFGVSVGYLLGTESDDADQTDKDIKLALFGSYEDITDEMLEEVKDFAQFIRARRAGRSETHVSPKMWAIPTEEQLNSTTKAIARDDSDTKNLKDIPELDDAVDISGCDEI
ncbi:MAG: helix-turn-helix transcriptional regulator [Ruminococcus sp.]|nr:helix-turn-helix transcriptional regulator [Ruminococcus sp.]